jgi:hypothetical protein
MKTLSRLCLLLLICTGTLLSCASTNEYTVSTDAHQRQFADISLSLRYVDRDELIARHGDETNPFVDFPGGVFDNKMIMVFELEIESTETSIIIQQKRINFEFGDKLAHPISEFHMKGLWEEHNADSREKDKRNKIIGDYVTQGKIEAGPDNPLSTYIIFRDRFPMYGESKFSLPIVTADLSDQAVIEFPFSFNMAYIDASKADPMNVAPSSDGETEGEKKSIFE